MSIESEPSAAAAQSSAAPPPQEQAAPPPPPPAAEPGFALPEGVSPEQAMEAIEWAAQAQADPHAFLRDVNRQAGLLGPNDDLDALRRQTPQGWPQQPPQAPPGAYAPPQPGQVAYAGAPPGYPPQPPVYAPPMQPQQAPPQGPSSFLGTDPDSGEAVWGWVHPDGMNYTRDPSSGTGWQHQPTYQTPQQPYMPQPQAPPGVDPIAYIDEQFQQRAAQEEQRRVDGEFQQAVQALQDHSGQPFDPRIQSMIGEHARATMAAMAQRGIAFDPADQVNKARQEYLEASGLGPGAQRAAAAAAPQPGQPGGPPMTAAMPGAAPVDNGAPPQVTRSNPNAVREWMASRTARQFGQDPSALDPYP